jgi:hypothetical protein
MEYDIPNPGFDCIATLDIETTHWKPRQGEVISVGIGVHDSGEPADTAEYELLHREDVAVDNELDLIRTAVGRLNNSDADGLVSYNGKDFDVEFLQGRMELNDAQIPLLFLEDDHVDLFELRKERCDRTGEDWPSLEDCLDSYGLPTPTTIWRGGPLTNVRFGEELGPAYLRGLANGGVDALQPAVDHYLQTDLEANFAIFYSDIGVDFEPSLLDSKKEF